MAQDWFDWHDRYDELEGYQQRLALVQRRIAEHLDQAPPGDITLISMCAGQGRDVAGALARHSRRRDVRGLLVELDPRNVAVARQLLADADAERVRAVVGDAGKAVAYRDAVPADLVLACGVFGNISDDDIAHTVESISMLCRPDATVVWTRHRFPPDLTPTIRRWFGEAGFAELGFDAVTAGPQSVGAHRLIAEPGLFDPAVRFFEFTR
jgi:hypothetical protein